jgi:isopenicillin-N epimerase
MSQQQASEKQALEALREAAEKVRLGRREFFKLTGVGAAGAAGLGASLPALADDDDDDDDHDREHHHRRDGRYASSFVLDENRLYMNVGTTGSTPKRVLKNLNRNNKLVAVDPLTTFATQTLRNTIAEGFGADPFEIVMSFNTTDGMSKIMAGLALPRGSEVITTNMEHPGGNGPMAIARDRDGLVLKRINLPTNDAMSDAEVMARFAAAVTPLTKAIVFSSPPFLTGTRLPEKALSLWAASRGLISIIDGAHAIGMVNLNFHDMGVDYYAGAGHKWQCGPGQTGIMYVRNGVSPAPYTKTVSVFNGLENTTTDNVVIDLPGYTNGTPLSAFFPTVSAAYTGAAGTPLANGTRAPSQNVAATLMSIGNPSYPALKALQECCSMWDKWGRQAIENYLVALAQYLRARLVGIWGPRCLAAPYDPSTPNFARVGLTAFNPFSKGADFNAVMNAAEAAAQTTASGNAVTALRDLHGIVVRNTNCPHTLRGNPSQNADPTTTSHPLRISTHLFHSRRDVDRLIAALVATVPRP